MTTVPRSLILIPKLSLVTVSGCGPLSGAGAAAQVAGIAPDAGAVREFVMRTIMQAVFDVLEQQGRAAGLPDSIIKSILNQLTVNITYSPLECKDIENGVKKRAN
ncbi:hypothetical protein KIN20_015093 [Parelaphostrongylus tenuis]|uniref:Uncharacterized protein n=1 Tax=Parelaphostrongylus tenuis TaxID=148309 RepID=A0AAD5MFM6_PARTN|nr:hypothetical protein KIN20_015093 [Parelaphostrongylus tenuis]